MLANQPGLEYQLPVVVQCEQQSSLSSDLETLNVAPVEVRGLGTPVYRKTQVGLVRGH